jgi:pectate lyase
VRGAALALLLALSSCGDHRLTTLRSPNADGGGGPPGDCNATLFGFATLGGGTNGGLGGERVTVSTYADLQLQAGRSERVVIQISGMIANAGQIQVSPRKTIVGLGPRSGLEGAGLNLTEGDIVVRNLVIRNVVGTDAITVNTATNVWIDHCDLSSDRDHNSEYYDGLVDVVYGSDDVTVSWTRFHDHFHTSLVGHSDDNADQDMNRLHVTFHHNWFENTYSFHPLIRFGVAHAFNNYYRNVATGVSARMGARVLAEANYFDTVETPLVTDEKSGETPGFVTEKGPNVYVNVVANQITQSADVLPPYPYAADPAADVPVLVERCAGTGKIVP